MRLFWAAMAAVAIVGSAQAAPVDLAKAAEAGDLAAIRLELDRGTGVDAPSGARAMPALAYAAARGRHEAMRLLLEAGADPNAVGANGLTCLHYAASAGDVGAIALLLDAGAKVDAVATTDMPLTPLQLALVAKRWPAARELLKAGSNLGATASGREALTLALGGEAGDRPPLDVELAALLVKNGAAIDARNASGETPVLLAVKGLQPELVRFMLSSGATLDDRTKDGKSALTLAAAPQMLETLSDGLAYVATFAAPEATGGLDGRALRLRMMTNGHGKLTGPQFQERRADIRRRRVAVLEILVKSGVDVTGAAGASALDDLVGVDDGDSVATLLRSGADPNAPRGSIGTTLLMNAAGRGHVSAMRGLLAGGARVDAVTTRGETALMRAASAGGDLGAVETLIAAGADVNALNQDGQTALFYAAGGRRDIINDQATSNPQIHGVVVALLAAGADPSIRDGSGKAAADYAKGPKYEAAATLLRDAAKHAD